MTLFYDIYYDRPYLTGQRTVTEEDLNLIKGTFQECDLERKGFLDSEDVKVAMVTLFGYKPSKPEVDDMLSGVKDSSFPGMPLDHFVKVMSAKMASKNEDDEIRQTFLAFDVHCRGFLTLDDLKRVFSQLAPHLSTTKIQAAFREIDRDGDGRVSYKDFEFMMKYNMEDNL